MRTYINFSACRYTAQTAIMKLRIDSPKTAWNEHVCAHQSHAGSKFSKTSLGLLCTRGIVVVYLYCGFSIRRQMTPQQTAKFRTAFLVIFYQFEEG